MGMRWPRSRPCANGGEDMTLTKADRERLRERLANRYQLSVLSHNLKALLDALDDAEARADEAQAAIVGLKSLRYEKGKLTALLGGDGVRVVVEMLASHFIETGAVNYVEYGIQTKQGGERYA